MEMNRYQEQARRTQNPELSFAGKKLHALHGLSAEVGEIHSIYQKVFQGHTISTDALIDEIGDLLWFIAELCDVIGVSLERVGQRNIAKLMNRYPDGFTEERSLNREE